MKLRGLAPYRAVGVDALAALLAFKIATFPVFGKGSCSPPDEQKIP